MAAVETLPPDQRAVLQMVLQRGRSYDQIAGLLSIDRAAVRQRALDALDTLTPASVLPGPERALVTDYLLRQLPEMVADEVRTYLLAAEADREWALAVADVIAPLASGALPEIPGGAPLGAAVSAAGGLERRSDPTAPAAIAAEPPSSREDRPPRKAPPSSRRGGAILLSLVAILIAAAIAVAVIGGGRSTPSSRTSTRTSSVSHSTTTVAQAPSTTTKVLAQLKLTAPSGSTTTIGIVQVVRQKGVLGVILDAQGLPANTAHNAYAVWLYNSASRHEFVGFVPNLVGKNGKLLTWGKLPAGAGAYHHLLITLETQSKPSRPGQVVLDGPFREHS